MAEGQIRIGVPWPRKPPTGTQINRSHPSVRGMVGCYLLGSQALVNLVSGVVTNMTASEGGLRRGNAFFDRPDASGVVLDLTTDDVFPQGTFMTQTFSPGVTGGTSTSVSADSLLALEARDASGLARVSLRVNGSPFNSDGPHTELGKDGSILTWRWDTAANSRKVNSSTGSGTSGVSITTPADSAIKLGARLSDNDLEIEEMFFAYFWNRFISDAEELWLRGNPWQIFQPRAVYIPVGVADVVSGRIMSSLAYHGGLVGPAGIAGEGGGLAS